MDASSTDSGVVLPPDEEREAAIALAILRGSVESRCRQAPVAFLAMLLNAIASVLLIGRGIHLVAVSVWLSTTTILMLLRYRIAVLARRELDGPHEAVLRFDAHFRLASITSQTVTGAGIWIVFGNDHVVAAYMMTVLISLYGVGAMTNLAHDYRSLRLTLPLLMGQIVLFWLLAGGEGYALAVIVTGLTVMMMSGGRRSQGIFDSSIRIRYEKDELLLELDEERRTALDALRQAEEANRSKTFFMAAASHDLRQPLYAANLLNNALAMHPLPPPAQRLVEQQGKALASAGALFDDLLDLSRFESGSILPAIGVVNLGELMQQIEAEFRPQCAEKGLMLTVDAAPCAVVSDYDLLARLVRNLMSNAVRYTEQGHILLHLARDDGHACLEVADTGRGIASEDHDRIFDAFQQGSPAREPGGRGVGLGLAIVRYIARLLHHALELESAPGKGTRVRLRLPLAPARAGATPTDAATATPFPGRAG